MGNTSASWTFSNDTSAATISWVTGSTARCNLRHTRRFSAPCFLTFHSPSPNTFSPVESITRSVIRPLGGLSIGHSHRAGPLAYAAIVRRTQRYVHQLEQGVEESLSGPQREVENPLEHQEGTNGLVGVELAATRRP